MQLVSLLNASSSASRAAVRPESTRAFEVNQAAPMCASPGSETDLPAVVQALIQAVRPGSDALELLSPSQTLTLFKPAAQRRDPGPPPRDCHASRRRRFGGPLTAVLPYLQQGVLLLLLAHLTRQGLAAALPGLTQAYAAPTAIGIGIGLTTTLLVLQAPHVAGS